MQTTDRPAKIFFEVMNQVFAFDCNDVCVYLLSDKPQLWFSRRPVVPREIAEDVTSRDRLHKRIKDKLPGEQPLEVFAPLDEAVPPLLDALVARLCANRGLSKATAYGLVYDTIVANAETMKWSLQVHTRGSDIYDNLLDGVRTQRFADECSRAVAALILFAAAGLIGDPMSFGPLAERAIRRACGVGVLDVVPLGTPPLPGDASADLSQASMGLQRILEGGVCGRRHTLDPEGSLIGSMPVTDGDYIADVDRTVSYEHLLVYEREGRWYAEGLGSDHGTLLERADGTTEVVEPPYAEQLGEAQPVAIEAGDVLVLGSTRFEVQRFLPGE